MKILSWDVGIKNLAYCLLETNDNKTSILDWGVINLMEDSSRECYGFIDSNNKRTKCSKGCKYYYQNGGITHYFCGLHKNQYLKLNKEILELKQIKTDKCCSKRKSTGQQCVKQGYYKLCVGDSKKIVCKYHGTFLRKKHNSNAIQKYKKPNANKAPILPILQKMTEQLNKNNGFMGSGLDHVAIENQPSMKNPKMKSVASALHAWFLIKGICEKKTLKGLHYLSPSNKLKINDENIQEEINKLPKNKQYAYTKSMAIVKTKQLLKNNEKWYTFLNKHSKQDDLCDCYLQGLYFISNKHKYENK